MGVDTSTLTPTSSLQADDAEDAAALRQMLVDAIGYITSRAWCPPIEASYLGFGIPHVAGVFLCVFQEPVEHSDDSLWVIVGDLPSAYLVTDQAPTARHALEVYCQLMEDWVGAVRDGGSLDDVFPVEAAATTEHADMLASRVAFIRSEILPAMG